MKIPLQKPQMSALPSVQWFPSSSGRSVFFSVERRVPGSEAKRMALRSPAPGIATGPSRWCDPATRPHIRNAAGEKLIEFEKRPAPRDGISRNQSP